MAWQVKCSDNDCKKNTWASNIVNLIRERCDEDGWFTCRCGKPGYTEKEFKLQEEGQKWRPFLRGAKILENLSETYFPFVFLVSYKKDNPVTDVWFCYYKDLRNNNGKLKLGHGPGGPPVLDKRSLLDLLRHLTKIGYLSSKDIGNLVNK